MVQASSGHRSRPSTREHRPSSRSPRGVSSTATLSRAASPAWPRSRARRLTRIQETTEPSFGHRRSATAAAGVTVAISGDINPATVGQAVTYTISVTNPGARLPPGRGHTCPLPKNATIVSEGSGSHTSSGIDFGVGSLGAGETRQFQIVVRPCEFRNAHAYRQRHGRPGCDNRPPASVTTTVVGAAPGDTPPPTDTAAADTGDTPPPTGDTPPPTGDTPPPTGDTPPPTGDTPPPTVLALWLPPASDGSGR